jgi:hypothetical protein
MMRGCEIGDTEVKERLEDASPNAGNGERDATGDAGFIEEQSARSLAALRSGTQRSQASTFCMAVCTIASSG